MDLYIIRHAIAEAHDPVMWPDDTQRPLTPRGRKRWARAVGGIGRVVPGVDRLLSSSYPRAWDTAQALTDGLGWPEPARCEALEAGHTPEEVVAALRAFQAERLAVVGHEPYLHELASYLLTGDGSLLQVELRKGAVLKLQLEALGTESRAMLDWLLQPKALRKLAAS